MLGGFLPSFKIIGLELKHLKMRKAQAMAAAPAARPYSPQAPEAVGKGTAWGGTGCENVCKCNHFAVFRNH